MKIALLSLLAGILTAVGQWYGDANHLCFTEACLKEFFAHLLPVITTGLVGLYMRKPGDISIKNHEDIINRVVESQK